MLTMMSETCSSVVFSSSEWLKKLPQYRISNDSQRRSAYEILRLKEATPAALMEIVPGIANFSPKVLQKADINAKYDPYIKRELNKIRAFERDENLQIPHDFDYSKLGTLSNESRSLLEKVRPETLGQARRIQGVTPTAWLDIFRYVKSTKNYTAS